MEKTKSKLIDDFYFLSELLDDDLDMVVDFLKARGQSKKSRSQIEKFVNNGKYDMIVSEIDQALDLPLIEFTRFKDEHEADRQAKIIKSQQVVIYFEE